MKQGAQPGTEPQPATPDTATLETPPRSRNPSLARAWSLATDQLDALDGAGALLRPALLPLATPPIVCAVALLFAQGHRINWLVAICALLASVLALAGLNALSAAQPSAATTGTGASAAWSASQPDPDVETHAAEQSSREQAARAERQSTAISLGVALLALAALCALPVLLAGGVPAIVAAALAIVAFALYGVDILRKRIAPLDELVAPACLGPGLFILTILALGQRMSLDAWLVAAALGGMAFAVIEGRRIASLEAAGARRSLATLLGPRITSTLAGIALLVSFAVAVALAVPKVGWPGALLALIALPTALIGLSGLAASHYAPARRAAAGRLAQAYVWYGLALAFGVVATVFAQGITAALVQALGL